MQYVRLTSGHMSIVIMRLRIRVSLLAVMGKWNAQGAYNFRAC